LQGAGGNCNVVKEIIYPLGAEIDVRAIRLGDKTMSVLEIWGAEYQENDCLLIKPGARALLEQVCARERCLMQVRGGGSGWWGWGGWKCRLLAQQAIGAALRWKWSWA
jgi:phosphoribosylformylglycinamidine synthase